MLEIIWSILKEGYPQIAGYILIIFLVGVIVSKSTKFYIRTNKICDEFDDTQKVLTKISNGFDKLNSLLLEKNIIHTSCYSDSNSPRVINELGKKLYEQSGAKEITEKILPDLLKKIEAKEEEFDSLLDVEKEALNVMLDERDNPDFKIIQNFVYNNPVFENNPLAYTDILFLISIKLRDEYFKKYPEILRKLN